ncbi:MAG: M24 family metallopeptidase [Pseudonocardiaceae bacterium]|nr:M24 family metallopeptidase [Pseudonocardiaceae bacterium]
MPRNPSRAAVSVEEYQQRLARIREYLRENTIDIAILTQPEHYNWISGYDPTSVFYFQPLFITADESEPTLLCNKAELVLMEETCWLDDVRTIWTFEDYVARAVEVVQEKGFGGDRPFRLGLNLSSYHLQARYALGLQTAFPNAELVDVTAGIDDLRLTKSAAEVGYLRRAAHIADLGVTAGINAIREGVTDREVLAAVQHAVFLNGGEFPAYPTLVDNRGSLHGTPTGRILRQGSTVYIEVSGVVRRYHCNISRTICVGEPTDELREMYRKVKHALDVGTEMLKPGAKVSEIVAVVDELQGKDSDQTWGRFGFSMEIAYPPIWIGGLSLMKGDDHVLEPGMVITMEPGLAYNDGKTMMFGNNVLVTEHRPEILNNVPTDLVVK